MGIEEFGDADSPVEHRDDIPKDPSGIGEPMTSQSRSNEKGRKYEHLAAANLCERGYLVIFPPKDVSYDLLISTKKRVYKAEVKHSTNSRERSGTEYHHVRLESTSSGGKPEHRNQYEFDYLIVYVVPKDNWYIIPATALGTKTGLGLSEQGKYGKFIDNW